MEYSRQCLMLYDPVQTYYSNRVENLSVKYVNETLLAGPQSDQEERRERTG